MAKTSITVLSLNVERSKHTESVVSLLEREQPDVFCALEVCAADLSLFAERLGAQYVFEPIAALPGGELYGTALFSRLPIVAQEVICYHKIDADVSSNSKPGQFNRSLVCCNLERDGTLFQFGATHFTWTPDGQASDEQRQDVEKLLAALAEQGELVLLGDFNAPRGKEIFSRIAEEYQDHVPLTYTTSIDGSLHRCGALPHMVDGFFSTPKYKVSNVRMVCGVSDHCALVGEVSL